MKNMLVKVSVFVHERKGLKAPPQRQYSDGDNY